MLNVFLQAKTKLGLSRVFKYLIPPLFAFLLFIGGATLLLTGALPSLPSNLIWLQQVIPLPVVEVSHLVASVIGLLLMFLARGIQLRVDAAWYASTTLLMIATIASIFRSGDWLSTVLLVVLLICMVQSRAFFNRRSSLLSIPFSPTWLALITIVVVSTAWIGFFSYKHIAYSDELWWQFTYDGDASRFLRSLVVLGVALLSIGILKLLSTYRPKVDNTPNQSDINEVLPLVTHSDDPQSYLALLGDKSFFWSEDRNAFLSFVVQPGYWIVMGDPVGKSDSFEKLLRQFQIKADRFACKVVFYQVSQHFLPYYLDLGLVMLKMGQDAQIDLNQFSLAGKKRGNLRREHNKLSKLDYRFDIIEGKQLCTIMPRLQEISDRWLAEKNTREKRFSLGFFKPEYIELTPVALVYSPDNEIVAFANLWRLDNKKEVCIDMMRYDPASQRGVMDFLFAELIISAQQQGFQRFNLGMAPLTGLERHRLAPLWHKIGSLVFDYGGRFYNFEGLYHFKEKFDPDWSPRYMALPAGISAPSVLMKTTILISGGWQGVFTR